MSEQKVTIKGTEIRVGDRIRARYEHVSLRSGEPRDTEEYTFTVTYLTAVAIYGMRRSVHRGTPSLVSVEVIERAKPPAPVLEPGDVILEFGQPKVFITKAGPHVVGVTAHAGASLSWWAEQVRDLPGIYSVR